MEKQWLPRSWQASPLQDPCSSIFCSTGRCSPKYGFTEFLFNWAWSTAAVYFKLHTEYILIILPMYRIIVRAPRESTSLDCLDQPYWRFMLPQRHWEPSLCLKEAVNVFAFSLSPALSLEPALDPFRILVFSPMPSPISCCFWKGSMDRHSSWQITASLDYWWILLTAFVSAHPFHTLENNTRQWGCTSALSLRLTLTAPCISISAFVGAVSTDHLKASYLPTF